MARKVKVKRQGYEVTPPGAPLPIKARLASYSPPGSGYHHDVGDIAGQTSVAKKKQMMAAARRRYDMSRGWDGAPNLTGPGSTPSRIPPSNMRPNYPQGTLGTEDPHTRERMQGRRRKGNRYYRTD